MSSQIPVYLFTGFLEAGKTKAIQETMEDERFNDGERTLILMCEEGEEEIDVSRFPKKNVYIEVIDDVNSLKADYLYSLGKKYKIERVVAEYNGMWQLSAFFEALPEKWFVYQNIMFADSNTFVSYNSNMRSLVVDKITNTEMIIFNRCENADRDEFHKIIRALSRQCAIAYEKADGTMEYDETEDPLPFDINAPIIEIDDRDYALWFRDMTEDKKKYIGKTIKFKGICAVSEKFPSNVIVCGRHIMTCCVEDISYQGILTIVPDNSGIKNRDWITLTATLSWEYNKLYRSKGPVLTAKNIEPAEPPEQEVATFY